MATRRIAPKKGVVKKKPARAPRRDPQVQVSVVGDLPPDQRHHNARSMRYQAAMAQVRKMGKGKGWASIATFDSANGAAAVKRAILRGERPVDGKLSDWEVESRRVRDDAGTITGSALYVRLK